MLKTKQVGKWTVSQAGMEQATKRYLCIKRAQQWIDSDAQKIEDEFTRDALSKAIMVYPQIAGCVMPVLTIHEFLQMPETELDELTTAAMELNPHWYASPDEKKSEATPTESTQS